MALCPLLVPGLLLLQMSRRLQLLDIFIHCVKCKNGRTGRSESWVHHPASSFRRGALRIQRCLRRHTHSLHLHRVRWLCHHWWVVLSHLLHCNRLLLLLLHQLLLNQLLLTHYLLLLLHQLLLHWLRWLYLWLHHFRMMLCTTIRVTGTVLIVLIRISFAPIICKISRKAQTTKTIIIVRWIAVIMSSRSSTVLKSQNSVLGIK